jgi:hypothetical protein
MSKTKSRIGKDTCQPVRSAESFDARESKARVVEWQTRTFEGRMPKGMRVQVPPRAPNPGSICWFASELFDLASVAYGFRSLF